MVELLRDHKEKLVVIIPTPFVPLGYQALSPKP